MWVYTHTHTPIPLYFHLPQTHALDRAATGIGCINTGQRISLDRKK